jgi:hypothetical protein
MADIDKTLAERGKRYGHFTEQFRVAQDIKGVMQESHNWSNLPPYMREALDMMAHKMSRILCGDSLHRDNWHDLVGYAKLIDDHLAILQSTGQMDDDL